MADVWSVKRYTQVHIIMADCWVSASIMLLEIEWAMKSKTLCYCHCAMAL